MTLKQFNNLQPGDVVFDKRFGHPFRFLKTVPCCKILPEGKNFRFTERWSEMACEFIEGYDYLGDYKTTGPYMVFKHTDMMIKGAM